MGNNLIFIMDQKTKQIFEHLWDICRGYLPFAVFLVALQFTDMNVILTLITVFALGVGLAYTYVNLREVIHLIRKG